MIYRGRFAPSPTGPLHAGSLLTALASYLQAKTQQGRWLVRIEDTDHTRCALEHETEILTALEAHHLFWDETPVRQSERIEQYRSILDTLIDKRDAYLCSCSRSELTQRKALQLYDGHCKRLGADERLACSIRLDTQSNGSSFSDRIQGDQQTESVGDFILYRRDRVFAYHLAVVADDEEQGITEIVRGSDLLEETHKHLMLQLRIGLETPSYVHLPIICAADGSKLSKQTGAEPLRLDEASIARQLYNSLKQLGQNPPAELMKVLPAEVMDWALNHWSLDRVPKRIGLEH